MVVVVVGGGAGGVKILSRPSLGFSFSQAEQYGSTKSYDFRIQDGFPKGGRLGHKVREYFNIFLYLRLSSLASSLLMILDPQDSVPHNG